MTTFFAKHKFAFKWMGIAFIIKGILFALIAILYYQNWPAHLITNYLFIASGDTGEYYLPIEAFVNHGVYESFCRMPGLLPIYAPLCFLFGITWGKTLVILAQFFASTISVYFLAQSAVYAFKNKNAFYYTFFLYAISTFVTNWDHVGYADSFGVSFLIYAIYFALKYRADKKLSFILFSGFFMIGSVFFRPVHGIFLPVIALLYIVDIKNLKGSIYPVFLYGLPSLIFISMWTSSNYSKYNKLIFLQGPNEECWGALNPVAVAVNDLIIAWGGDFQPWSLGSEAEWFYTNSPSKPKQEAIPSSYFTSNCNYDTLFRLRNDYETLRRDTSLTASEKFVLGNTIIKRCELFIGSYKSEHAFNFYFTNKLKILKDLIAPKRLDDFPTPAFSNMNLFHKLLKAFYFLLLLFVCIVGFLTSFFMLIKRNFFALLPLTILGVIVLIFGYVEQRYIAPAYPLLLVCTFPLFDFVLGYFQSKKSK